jgi:signal transduction histidine kinase
MDLVMRRKLLALSRRYARALRQHLKQGPQATLEPARGLGSQAVNLGLETLDVARIHQKAFAALEASRSRDGLIEQAEIFFAEAVSPIEKTHGAALKSTARLEKANKRLERRTVDLAALNRSLKQSIVRRKAVEQALKKSGGHSRKLLEESHRLQNHLQRLTQRILTMQEDKRKKISHELQDEVAQTLLGINVRLLTLKKEAALCDEGFKKGIASTQRLVNKSVKTVKRFRREFGKPDEE